ncbi:MAG: ribosomal protein S18-alanine N-acetyltransferase [Anaerolineae bacterium]|nr:ribosomal protein S18-alanine N-acetyltransferase [Anaerolineae bacterium]
MTRLLRHMRMSDVPDVVTIDQISFDPAWSAQAYQFEVAESSYSHMVILEEAAQSHPTATGLGRLLRTLAGRALSPGVILGYGGLWHIDKEAHISTIAVHPRFRGLGYGELLLAAMCVRALYLRAAYVILEVRVSNAVAQNLYRKFGFETRMVKPRYYHSDGEDAYEMRLNLLPETKERLEKDFPALLERIEVKDEFTTRSASRRF